MFFFAEMMSRFCYVRVYSLVRYRDGVQGLGGWVPLGREGGVSPPPPTSQGLGQPRVRARGVWTNLGGGDPDQIKLKSSFWRRSCAFLKNFVAQKVAQNGSLGLFWGPWQIYQLRWIFGILRHFKAFCNVFFFAAVNHYFFK